MTEAPTPATGTAHLQALGRISWETLAATLTTAQETAWADYDGFHIGAPPTQPPPYSHLWAWSTEWLIRVRLDAGTAIGAVLHLAEPTTGHPDLHTVQWTLHHTRSWPDAENRVGPLSPDVTDRTVELYNIHPYLSEVPTAAIAAQPISFVRVHPKR
ncbi:hypothetical protein [Mangrovihabitans endophyticus]|uniref:Uncharacterized protein n=1 Tax=Mangrovihabitans endophyticus TaxID=1751298 RepID=A0A8J3C8B8_9ACTN|nr:hypothetical protein [Mangrovihabitans endophyticus]GGL19451.1 hypothetical protein GCM10012284_62470 [Mangrovihabitans endophyticus]